MKKYNVNYYWTVTVEADTENEAIEKADEIANGDILGYNDLSVEAEEVQPLLK